MKARAIAVGLAVGVVSAMGVLTLSHVTAEAKAPSIPVPSVSVEASPEVTRVAGLSAKDAARARNEMMALYRQDGLRTGPDYRVAAKTLETSKSREDLLMAHDMAVAALALGDRGAKLVVARTEDRLFRSLGLGERFGTQKRNDSPLTATHRDLMTTDAPAGPLRPAVMAAAV